jgi:hypothetical protein
MREATLTIDVKRAARSARLRWLLGTALLLAVGAGGSFLVASLRVRPALGLSRSVTPLTPVEPATPVQDAADEATSSTSDASPAVNSPEVPPAADGATPRWDVELKSFDFGQMDPHTIGQHTFLVRNVGDAPLRLLDHRSTCKCTASKFPREPIAPGQAAEVLVQWQTQEGQTRFEESATVETNDPRHPSLTFTITGRVLVHVGANPPEFSLPSVRPDTRPSASTIVSSQVYTDLTLRNVRSSLEGLEWTLGPATPEECQKLHAQCGQRLTVQLPDTLPQGHFTHWVRFEVVPGDGQAEPREYELPLRGKVMRRLAVYGAGIDSEGNVRLGVVPADRVTQHQLMLKVYDQQPELAVERIEVVPDFLQVSLAPYQTASSAAGLYRLQIEVPATAPAGNYQENNAARLTIHFAHPRIAELKLQIHLAVARHLAAAP